MRTPAILLLPALASAQVFVKYQSADLIATADLDTSSRTVRVVEGASIGTCVCDITLNQCDANCCCDSDCSQAVLDIWQADEDQYCQNYIGQNNQPLTKCIDLRYIESYNIREDKGMKVTIENGELCVELDTGSSFSDYIMPLSSIDVYPESEFSVSAQSTSTSTTTTENYKLG